MTISSTNNTVIPFIQHTETLVLQGEPTSQSQTALVSQKTSNRIDLLGITEIALAIFSHCDFRTLQSLACVNKFLNACVQAHDDRLDLCHLCPNLQILNAEAQGITISDEPSVSKRWILENYIKLEPYVEDGEGLTLLTMPQGRTLGQLIAIAAQAGINATPHWAHHQIMEEHGNVPIEQTYVILITNSVFQQSRNKSYAQQQELVAGHRCVIPTVQEYVALCVFTNEVLQRSLYRQNPLTYGRTSTQVNDHPLVVGGSSPVRLPVSRSPADCKDYGVGGQRKFGH